MEERSVKFEELLAGALLKFGSVDETDMAVLIEDLETHHIYCKHSSLFELLEYVKKEDNVYSLKDGLNLDSNIAPHAPFDFVTLRQRVQLIQGEFIPRYLKNLDLSVFVLKKLRYLEGMDKERIYKTFNKTELEILDMLFKENYISTVWNDDIPHQNYQEIILTWKGNVQLFKHENKGEINRFIEDMHKEGYDIRLLDGFLGTQDLSSTRLRPCDILTIYNFNEFCNKYDRCPYQAVSNITDKLEYIGLNYEQGSTFDSEGKKLMRNMLTVWDDEHSIYVCHPNHIFNSKPISADNREITSIDWDSIDPQKMIRIGDYKIFLYNNGVFRYIHNRLRNEIIKLVKAGRKEVAIRHLVIIEKYPFNDEYNFLVRGIIRADNNGYSVVFNPEYENSIPQNVFNQSLRLCDNEAPDIYKLKRNGIPKY